jgi:hypothetical protein
VDSSILSGIFLGNRYRRLPWTGEVVSGGAAIQRRLTHLGPQALSQIALRGKPQVIGCDNDQNISVRLVTLLIRRPCKTAATSMNAGDLG